MLKGGIQVLGRSIHPILALVVAFFAVMKVAQGPTLAVEKKNENPQVLLTPFEYKPLDLDFWRDVQATIKDGNTSRALSLAADRLKEVKKGSIEASEVYLIIAKILSQENLSYAASHFLGEIIKNEQGSQAQRQALVDLEGIVKKFPVDEDEVISELLIDIEHDPDHLETKDFLNYHMGVYHLTNGSPQWAQRFFEKIQPTSYWSLRLKYQEAVDLVAQGKIDEAMEAFQKIAKDPQSPSDLQTEASHQYARLLFEKSDFSGAYDLFKSLNLPLREKGLTLMERSWTQYYLKNYSKTLGLLMAYESPLFNPSRSGESYILRILIYKELCYFDTALQVVSEFEKRYGPTIQAIRKRADLSKDQVLVNLSLLDRRIQFLVTYLNNLREEEGKIRLSPFKKYAFLKPLLKKYKEKGSEVEEKLGWVLRSKTREMAELVLDWQEQIQFLDYQTRIDKLKVETIHGSTNYQAEEIQRVALDKVYWMFKNEFWQDELEDLKVNVESQCQKTRQNSKGGE